MTRFDAERVLDRALGIVAGDEDELRALEDRLAAFVAALASAGIDDRDDAAATLAYVERLGAAGLLGLVVPARFGGVHERVRSTPICIARQWLARTSGALDSAFVMQGLGSYPVTLGGGESLRASLLPRVAAGSVVCAFALTEPGAGSDVAAMATRATPHESGGVVLDGEKCFISNAGIATSYVVFAREAYDGPGGKPRFGAFWVAGDAAGLSVEPIRVIAPHPIGTVHLRGVVVPAEHRLGALGEGMKLALSTLDVFRVTVGAAALGLADRALSETVAHLERRVQFGKPLADQQGLRFLVAEVATEHVAAQMLVYRAAAARDAGTATPDQAAMAKLYATESAQRVIDRAVQSLGGLGVTVGSAPERLYREIRALRIYEGTSEIQKLVIARALFGK
jgi:acyl-CoA dehydrogenase